MLNKINFFSLSLMFATALSMGLSSTSFATCDEEIAATETRLFDHGGDLIGTFGGMSGSLGVISSDATFGTIGAVSLGVAGVSTTIDHATSLSKDELYANQVLYDASYNHEAAEILNFIKYAQKEISRNKTAVIPTDEEIRNSLDYLNRSLIACRNEKHKFQKPTKEDLLSKVRKDLNI